MHESNLPGPSDEFVPVTTCDGEVCFEPVHVVTATNLHRRPVTSLYNEPMLLTASFEQRSCQPRIDGCERLYKEHFKRAEKRASIMEYEQKEREAELKKLTFHPNLQLTFREGRAAGHQRQASVTLTRRSTHQYFKDMMVFESNRKTKLREMRRSFQNEFKES